MHIIYLYTQICVYINIYIYIICIYTCMYIYIYMYVCVRVWFHACMHAWMHISCRMHDACMHVCAHVEENIVTCLFQYTSSLKHFTHEEKEREREWNKWIDSVPKHEWPLLTTSRCSLNPGWINHQSINMGGSPNRDTLWLYDTLW